jgi:hypothetical protein
MKYILLMALLAIIGWVAVEFIMIVIAEQKEQERLDYWQEQNHRKLKASGEFDEY